MLQKKLHEFHKIIQAERADGRLVRRTDRQTEGRTDERTGGRKWKFVVASKKGKKEGMRRKGELKRWRVWRLDWFDCCFTAPQKVEHVELT